MRRTMLSVYFNYPNCHITAHSNAACSDIGKMKKLHQRRVLVDATTIDYEIARFTSKSYRFASTAAYNDMWLDIDLANLSAEQSVLDQIHRLLAASYSPFARVDVDMHC